MTLALTASTIPPLIKSASKGKACAINPLKVSAPLGAAMALLGIERSVPLLHGSQGCTAFALVLMVRHFKEPIPLQTTAMNEITTILGGSDNIEEAILTLLSRKPALIGLCSTGLTETRSEDIIGDLALIRSRQAEALEKTEIVYVPSPDYIGGLQEGWGAAAKAVIETLVEAERRPHRPHHVNVLAGSHLTAGDLEALYDLMDDFGLNATIFPDLSDSLDGHVPDEFMLTSSGGTSIEAIRGMGRSALTIAIGHHMRPAAKALEDRTGVPTLFLDGLTGLAVTDRLISVLSDLSGKAAPFRVRRDRSRLLDAMLDGHFAFSGRQIAVAAEPDLLNAVAGLCTDLGATVRCAVSTVASPALERVVADRTLIGDLEDLETFAQGSDLVIGPSSAARTAATLNAPLLRMGFPQFDHLGGQHRSSIGYVGTRSLIFDIANLLQEHAHGHAA